MKAIKIRIKNNTIRIPNEISEMMGWEDDDILQVPFHEFIKVSKGSEESVSPSGKKEAKVKIGGIEKIVRQEDVIRILQSATPEMESFRTAYISYQGKRYGIKAICQELFKTDKFHTNTGEALLKKLGFSTFRV